MKEVILEHIASLKDSTYADAEEFRLKYLSKNGILRNLTNQLSEVANDEKKEIGALLNQLKEAVQEKYVQISEGTQGVVTNSLSPEFYKSLPGRKPEIGHLHLITQAIREISSVFTPLGFTRRRYPEVDWEYNAFEALNMGLDHPARDEWETFFIQGSANSEYGRAVITPHTSSGQVREMLRNKPPIKMLNIARCGRRQIDVSHVPSFYQFEGLVVDENITIANLKGVIEHFVTNFFGLERQFRLRPYNFPFTEPSFEIDVTCSVCQGKGCRLCKEGWLELGGAGMVHPKVLEYGGVDTTKYTGFAFGWGVERTYIMKSGLSIPDIRLLWSNDFKFLEQF